MTEMTEETCVLCFETFDLDDMIELAGNRVCAGCKPEYVKMYQQGLMATDLTIAREKKVLVMGEVKGGNEARYIHGNFGKGTFTFFGGHDPEDYQHFVGDPPTDLDLYPRDDPPPPRLDPGRGALEPDECDRLRGDRSGYARLR